MSFYEIFLMSRIVKKLYDNPKEELIILFMHCFQPLKFFLLGCLFNIFLMILFYFYNDLLIYIISFYVLTIIILLFLFMACKKRF